MIINLNIKIFLRLSGGRNETFQTCIINSCKIAADKIGRKWNAEKNMCGSEKITEESSLFFIIVHVERMQKDGDQQVNDVGYVFYCLNTFFYSFYDFLWFYFSFLTANFFLFFEVWFCNQMVSCYYSHIIRCLEMSQNFDWIYSQNYNYRVK